MPEVWFAIPGNLNTLTGGYVYARRLMEALPTAGWTPRHLQLSAAFPDPTPVDLAAARAQFAALRADVTLLVDGLALGAMPAEILRSLPARIVALVHHPLAMETGVSLERAAYLKTCEREALALAAAVIVTSRYTATVLETDYGVPRAKLHVAVPGTDEAPRANPRNAAPVLLTVATVTPRKGHDVLIEALARLADLPWTSICVGSVTRDPPMADAVRALARRYKLESRIRFTGELEGDALGRAFTSSDIFVLPSRYEGYGMVFADALARGLPIVACAAGAVTGTVPPGAGLLVPPDNPDSLADALRQLITDPQQRRRMSDAAWNCGRSLPRWRDTAAKVAAALAP